MSADKLVGSYTGEKSWRRIMNEPSASPANSTLNAQSTNINYQYTKRDSTMLKRNYILQRDLEKNKQILLKWNDYKGIYIYASRLFWVSVGVDLHRNDWRRFSVAKQHLHISDKGMKFIAHCARNSCMHQPLWFWIKGLECEAKKYNKIIFYIFNKSFILILVGITLYWLSFKRK